MHSGLCAFFAFVLKLLMYWFTCLLLYFFYLCCVDGPVTLQRITSFMVSLSVHMTIKLWTCDDTDLHQIVTRFSRRRWMDPLNYDSIPGIYKAKWRLIQIFKDWESPEQWTYRETFSAGGGRAQKNGPNPKIRYGNSGEKLANASSHEWKYGTQPQKVVIAGWMNLNHQWIFVGCGLHNSLKGLIILLMFSLTLSRFIRFTGFSNHHTLLSKVPFSSYGLATC